LVMSKLESEHREEGIARSSRNVLLHVRMCHVGFCLICV
jgi:hypothetical protein